MPQMPSFAPLNNRFVCRLGPHHFAHLRAVAEGLDLGDCARRFLGIEHGHEARTAHQQAVDAVRAVARRRGETAWRLIGLPIGFQEGLERPSLAHFMEERGLEGFSETDVLELYEEACPADRKTARGQRLRERQLALLRKLQGLAAEQPLASDLVSGWFDDVTAAKLVAAGWTTLGDLNAKVSAGGRWYSALPAIGQAKTRRIAGHLATLLPRDVKPAKRLFFLKATPTLFAAPTRSDQAVCDPENFDVGTPTGSLLRARGDIEAVQAWIKARAGSVDTAKVYQREASRLMLWLQYERQGSKLTQMSVNDCGDFMAFLQNIPASWISRERAKPGTAGGRLSGGRCPTRVKSKRSSSSLPCSPGFKPRSTSLATLGCW